MKRTLLCGLLLPLGALAPALPVPPHGGVYRGPGAGVGPGGSAGGTNTPGGGSGTYSDWSTWWSFNRDPYLALKSAIHEEGALTGSGDFDLGQGQELRGRASLRPTDEDLGERVVPALVSALRSSDDQDLVTACLIALGKAGHEASDPDLPRLGPLITRYLESDNQEIAETAAVALGVLGNEVAAPTLGTLVANDAAGRKRVDARKVPDRTRALAAYGLGLVGTRTPREDVRRFVVHHLTHALRNDDTATRDLPTACVISLGIVPLVAGEEWAEIESLPENGPTTREEQVAWLLHFFEEGDADTAVRAHIPQALARLTKGADPQARVAVATRLLSELRQHKRTPQDIRRSAVIALGILGDDDGDVIDFRIRDGLRSLTDDRDAMVRDLARISLAKVAARRGTGPDAGSGENEIRGFLLRDLARGRTGTRAWTAVALGVFEFERMSSGRAPSEDVRGALRSALDSRSSPIDQGALAVALGLARDPRAAPALREILTGGGPEGVRAFAAVSLGLIGDHESTEDLAELVRKSTYRPGLQREAAIALALLGDRSLVGELASSLREAKTLASQSSIGMALGFIGDRRAIDALLEVLEDPDSGDRTRAFAAAALGVVGDKEDLTWNSKLAVDIYYGRPVATLTDTLGARGILDLL